MNFRLSEMLWIALTANKWRRLLSLNFPPSPLFSTIDVLPLLPLLQRPWFSLESWPLCVVYNQWRLCASNEWCRRYSSRCCALVRRSRFEVWDGAKSCKDYQRASPLVSSFAFVKARSASKSSQKRRCDFLIESERVAAEDWRTDFAFRLSSATRMLSTVKQAS